MSGKRITRSTSRVSPLPGLQLPPTTSTNKSTQGVASKPPTQQVADDSLTQPRAQGPIPKGKQDLTRAPQIGEQEPRRSVRATKGQHTKAFEALENGPQPTKRRQSTKKVSKKAAAAAAAAAQQEEEDEEVIRCVCGATSQENDDPNEPWIACEKCGVWQHNVCMGMSIFDDDLPKEYFCEQCKPEDHKSLLDGMASGEKPWETRRQKHEEENKKKKGKKGKAKRVSDPKDRSSPATSTGKAKPSPAPEVKKDESSDVKGKRKSRDQSQGPQGSKTKMRKVSETHAAPAPAAAATSAPISAPISTSTAEQKPATASGAGAASPIAPAAPAAPATPAVSHAVSVPPTSAPADLATSIDKMDNPTRKAAAQGICKSLEIALDQALKDGLYKPPKTPARKLIAERLALEIERAVYDHYPNTAAASQHTRTLMFNLKKNIELAARVFNSTLSPHELAVMSTDQMATKELQRETAEMKAKADKQSILITEEGPRVRRTHKGEELVENESFNVTPDEAPSTLRRQSLREVATEATKSANEAASSKGRAEQGVNAPDGPVPMQIDTQVGQQQSPQQRDFDIDKVFSSVTSPSGASHHRRLTQPGPSVGPGDDPEVDRLLDDGNDSPPYSPTDNTDPEVVWQGQFMMTNVADISVVAKYAGGADLSKLRGISWQSLIPPLLTVAGRIPEDKAVPYLCGQRYNNQVDIVIASLSPLNPSNADVGRQWLDVINYFLSKKRYGVVGERKLGNVRDTYLIPVAKGDGPIPEPIQNIADHRVPTNRSEPMMLVVFVIRDEKQPQVSKDHQMADMQGITPSTPAPNPGPDRNVKQPSAGPTWPPATAQGSFPNGAFPTPNPHQSHTPIPPPVIPGQPAPAVLRQNPVTTPTAPPTMPPNASAESQEMRQARIEGENRARQVLGPYFNTKTVTFLLSQAWRMREAEWSVVRKCMEINPKACDSLPLLSKLLTEEGQRGEQARQQQRLQQQQQQQQPQQLQPPQQTQSQPHPQPVPAIHQQQPPLQPLPQPSATASPVVIQNTLAAAAATMPPGPGPAAPHPTLPKT